MKFSVAHFTIFSPTERENIHGHNYYVRAKITAAISEIGLAFDYRDLRKFILQKCKELNERFLLPASSPYVKIEEIFSEKAFKIVFDKETMILPKRDVLLLPIVNISSESLSAWFLLQLTEQKKILIERKISKIEMIISTTTGHGCSALWSAYD
jgi:6-pyruvoyltetrahydropterin/6-carboxytetrahydropterin synthase